MTRTAQQTDIQQIAEVHRDAFQGFFLTGMGMRFLETYYGSFLSCPETVTLVETDEEGAVVGFAIATTKAKGFNGRLARRNFWNFARVSLNILFHSPKSLIHLAKNMTKKSDVVADDENHAELYSFGVRTANRNKGIGKKLLLAMEEALKAKGVTRVSLTTDCEYNEAAIALYRKMNYKLLYEFTAYPERKMYRLIKNI